MSASMGKSGQAKFRDWQVAQYDWGMGYEGEAREVNRSPVIRGRVFCVREPTTPRDPSRKCFEIQWTLSSVHWWWQWLRLLVSVQGKDSSPKKGSLTRQSRVTGNKRGKIFMWILVLGTRRNSELLIFSQTLEVTGAEFQSTKMEFLNSLLSRRRNQVGFQGVRNLF